MAEIAADILHRHAGRESAGTQHSAKQPDIGGLQCNMGKADVFLRGQSGCDFNKLLIADLV